MDKELKLKLDEYMKAQGLSKSHPDKEIKPDDAAEDINNQDIGKEDSTDVKLSSKMSN